MNILVQFLVFSFLCSIQYYPSKAFYQCGIRQHGFLPLVHQGWTVEEGQWPWHTAVFHKIEGVGFQYKCGATLVNERHVLTAAHCVVKRHSKNALPAILHEIELHFGQHNLSKVTDNVVIRDVSKAHVHPEYATHKNDIAVLVLRLPVEYFEYVIPICLDQNVGRDLRELEGQRGWITGWGKTENGTISEILRTSSLPIVDHVQCLKNDRLLFGNILDENVFCAGYRNGTSPGPGDSGGGLYVSDGDRWVLRGIVSFGKANELKKGVDPYKYTVFVNVQQYLTWIKEIVAESEPQRDRRQKRISESECERFHGLSKKRRNGDCLNNRHPHNVMILQLDGKLLCNGVLVDENYVVTTCNCIRPAHTYQPAKVRIEAYGEVTISEMFCHPQYIDKKTQNDLAIIKLARAVTLSSSLIPACLANNWTENLYDILLQSTFVHEGQDLIILYESDENRITTTGKCESWFEYWKVGGFNHDSALCVTNSDPLRRASYGARASTGDALQSSNRRSCMFTVVGIKSRSSDKYYTRNSDFPTIDVYARISHHLDWIEESVWNETPIDVVCGVDYKWDKLWHVAIFQRNITGNDFDFSCSATLISAKHVITTASCLVNQTTGRPLAEDTFELKVGLEQMSQPTAYTQTRYVSEVHVHPESAVNDIGILVTTWPFRITQDVKPICLSPAKDANIWNADGEISGWETIETGISKDIRRSERIGILDYQTCSKASLDLSGYRLPANMFCSDYPKECERFGQLSRKHNGVCENDGNSTNNNYPHIVSLLDEDQNVVCLGALVKEDRVLTACKCVRGAFRPTKVGLNIDSSVDITDVICHPGYSSSIESHHDIAIVKLRTAVELSSQVIPACLANYDTENLEDAVLQTSLYRNVKENPKETTPYATYEYIGSAEECDRTTAPNNTEKYSFLPGQFCVISSGSYAGANIELNDAVVQSIDNRICQFTVIGIASAAINNNDNTGRRPELAAIVNRVAYYLNWIEQVVWEEKASLL